MPSSHRILQAFFAGCLFFTLSLTALGADPGVVFPPESDLSDQKAGSVLFYVVYTSSTTSPNTTNTQINVTNTNVGSAAFVHLFFVAQNCSVADRFMCLTAQQTASFTTYDEDPGTTGYLVAVAVDGILGCPLSFNYLIGDLFFKSGDHEANLGAEAFAALYTGTLPGCDQNSITATLFFTGTPNGYNRAGKVLAVASIPSMLDGNDTRIVVIRVGGDLVTGPRDVGTIFGLTFNDAEQGFSWSTSVRCQLFARLTNDFPRTVPRFTDIIPQNQTGWLKFYTVGEGNGIIGAVLNANPNTATQADAFTGGHNLHKLTLTPDAATMPIFTPTC
jgi:hypothetical protein